MDPNDLPADDQGSSLPTHPEPLAGEGAEQPGPEAEGAQGAPETEGSSSPPEEPSDWDIDAAIAKARGDAPGTTPGAGTEADHAGGGGDGTEEPAAAPNPGDSTDARPADPKAEAEAAPGQKSGDDEDEAALDSDPELERDLSQEELRGLKGPQRRRIRRLQRDRAKFRAELDELRPVAERARPLVERMQANDLSTENMNELLELGAMLRAGKLREFRDAIQPYMDAVDQALGLKLPADLQEQVEVGDITQERAAELARLRHEATSSRQELERTRQTQADQHAEERRQSQVQQVSTALNEWEQTQLAADPDYSHIKKAVTEQVQLEVRAHGMPTNPAQARELADRALARVKSLGQLSRPARASTPPRPSANGATVGTAPPPPSTPQSLEDAIEAGLRRAQGAG